MADIVMPRLSDSMEEGTILQWLKQVGDEVAVGDELVEIETDKANMAYESDVAGTLTEILAQEGETVAIGTPIAPVGNAAETSSRDEEGTDASAAGPVAAGDPPPPPVAKASSGAVPPTAPPAGEAINAPSGSNGGGRPHASPIADGSPRRRVSIWRSFRGPDQEGESSRRMSRKLNRPGRQDVNLRPRNSHP